MLGRRGVLQTRKSESLRFSICHCRDSADRFSYFSFSIASFANVAHISLLSLPSADERRGQSFAANEIQIKACMLISTNTSLEHARAKTFLLAKPNYSFRWKAQLNFELRLPRVSLSADAEIPFPTGNTLFPSLGIS
jgi:hypothetical protein